MSCRVNRWPETLPPSRCKQKGNHKKRKRAKIDEYVTSRKGTWRKGRLKQKDGETSGVLATSILPSPVPRMLPQFSAILLLPGSAKNAFVVSTYSSSFLAPAWLSPQLRCVLDCTIARRPPSPSPTCADLVQCSTRKKVKNAARNVARFDREGYRPLQRLEPREALHPQS